MAWICTEEALVKILLLHFVFGTQRFVAGAV